MKYIITENQYTSYRKSVIRRLLRRAGRRIDEIVEESLEDNLNWFSNPPGRLNEMGPDGLAQRIIDDVWEYVYTSHFDEETELSDEERGILYDYLFFRFLPKITESYYEFMDKKNIKEEEIKGRNKNKFFQELIDNALRYIKVSCDLPYTEFPSNLDYRICDDAEVVRRIDVLDANPSNMAQYRIDVRVEYYSNREHVDMSDVTYQIEQIMKKSTGMKFWIYEKENINRNKNRQW